MIAMKNLVVITVAGGLLIATATAQTLNRPAPHDSSAVQSQQQSMPGMGMGGVSTVIEVLQTDSSLPAPELLQDVAARPARKLAEFLNLADENNPTLKQAAAIVQRSEAQARQAGLYP